MAALDSFNWFVTSNIRNASEELKKTILDRREYLLTLRNEDERERYVHQCIKEFNALMKEKD